MKYTRLYADDDRESHFEDVDVKFSDSDYAPPAPPLGLSAFAEATQAGFMKARAGWESDWHPSSARNLFVVLTGEWEVTASDNETRKFGPGTVLLVEDTIGKGHASRVISESIAVMVQLSP